MRVSREASRGRLFYVRPVAIQERVYFPQMCSMNTDAMKISDMTSTGTGPLQAQRNSTDRKNPN